MSTYNGKLGEYLVLCQLLIRGIEAYPAIIKNQENFDITVITKDKKVLRIQVKFTVLQNKSKNNLILKINKEFDFLVIVVDDNGSNCFLVLSKEEVSIHTRNSNSLYISEYSESNYIIRSNLLVFKDRWNVIETT